MSENDHSLVPLKEHLETRLKDAKEALILAKEQLEKRLDHMNEWRAHHRDQSAAFLTRNEFNILHSQIVEDIRYLREAKAALDGKASQMSVNISMAFALIGTVLSIFSLLHSLFKL